MIASSFALQAAIRESLETEPGLIALIGEPNVYDRVPPDAPLPYITFGDWRVEENDTDDARIDSHIFMIEVWSAYAGLKQAKAIAVVIELALHGAALDLEDHRLIDLSFIASAYGQDQREGVSQGALRFRALTQRT